MKFRQRSGLSGIGLLGVGMVTLLFGIFTAYSGYSAAISDAGGGDDSSPTDTPTGTYTGSYTGTDNSLTYTTIVLTSTVACQTTNYPSNLEVITITRSSIICSYPSTSGSKSWTTSTTIATNTGADNSITYTTIRYTSTVLCQTTNYPSHLQAITITSSTFVCTYASASAGSTTTVTRTSTVLCQTTNYPSHLQVITITKTALACTYTTTTGTVIVTSTKTVACQTTNYPSNLQVITITRTAFACTYTTQSLNYVPSLSTANFLGIQTEPVYIEALGGMIMVFGILFSLIGVVMMRAKQFSPSAG